MLFDFFIGLLFLFYLVCFYSAWVYQNTIFLDAVIRIFLNNDYKNIQLEIQQADYKIAVYKRLEFVYKTVLIYLVFTNKVFG